MEYVKLFAILAMALLLFGCLSLQQQASSPSASHPLDQLNESEVLPVNEGNETTLPDEIPVPLSDEEAASGFILCQSRDAEICTMEYSPVCARSGGNNTTYAYAEYGNPCMACAKTSPATGYYMGTCEENNFAPPRENGNEIHPCPQQRNEFCTMEYNPVCGRLVGATPDVAGYRDYGNPCLACSRESNAIAYYKGTCKSRGAG